MDPHTRHSSDAHTLHTGPALLTPPSSNGPWPPPPPSPNAAADASA